MREPTRSATVVAVASTDSWCGRLRSLSETLRCLCCYEQQFIPDMERAALWTESLSVVLPERMYVVHVIHGRPHNTAVCLCVFGRQRGSAGCIDIVIACEGPRKARACILGASLSPSTSLTNTTLGWAARRPRVQKNQTDFVHTITSVPASLDGRPRDLLPNACAWALAGDRATPSMAAQARLRPEGSGTSCGPIESCEVYFSVTCSQPSCGSHLRTSVCFFCVPYWMAPGHSMTT